jgi:phage-related minor tail protein
MAANRIKGITIEIGGDTTKLQTALKGVNTEIRSASSWGRLLRKQRINWRL